MKTILSDRYQILNQLGSGGFGETFLAEDTQTATKVVIKSLQPIHQQTTAEITEKLFQKEASVLKDLGSQCNQIPTLYDYFTEDGKYYLVQEYIEGEKLAHKGVITSKQCLKILLSLLDTLQYIHNKNIIHRDIKPENIIIKESDRLPVFIDFGEIKESMGISASPMEKKAFVAPEQSTGRTVFSSDLYSLALTMIYSLTGKLPTEIPANPMTGELDWQKLVTDLDPVLDQVLSKASKMDIPSRYLTAVEMTEALSLSLSELPIDTENQLHDVPSSYQNERRKLRYAGFWRRVAAIMLDCFLLVASIAVIESIFFLGEVSLSLVQIVVGWLYFGLMESSFYQATLGKQALGIKVIGLEGNKISFARATGRYFAKNISALILLIGFIMVAFNPKKRALHDIIAGTLVVKN